MAESCPPSASADLLPAIGQDRVVGHRRHPHAQQIAAFAFAAEILQIQHQPFALRRFGALVVEVQIGKPVSDRSRSAATTTTACAATNCRACIILMPQRSRHWAMRSLGSLSRCGDDCARAALIAADGQSFRSTFTRSTPSRKRASRRSPTCASCTLRTMRPSTRCRIA